MKTIDCGKRIRSLKGLIAASLNRRSVVVPSLFPWASRHPAAFMINLSGVILDELFDKGMFEYRSIAKKRDLKKEQKE